MKNVRLVIISGHSCSGKITAIKVLEDLKFFCVDNLPVVSLPKFMELSSQYAEITKLAVVVDVMEREILSEFPAVLKDTLKNSHLRCCLRCCAAHISVACPTQPSVGRPMGVFIKAPTCLCVARSQARRYVNRQTTAPCP
ncbi:MAG: hypothetical protein HZB80_03360 [Deltaproteobacteria bacterium]|nr:hypothetical protein [Deltaproteobacteria bacterium]